MQRQYCTPTCMPVLPAHPLTSPHLAAVLYTDFDMVMLRDPLAYLAQQPSTTYDVQARCTCWTQQLCNADAVHGGSCTSWGTA